MQNLSFSYTQKKVTPARKASDQLSSEVAIALFDHRTREFKVCCFNDHGNFANLEAVLLQMAPSTDLLLKMANGEGMADVNKAVKRVIDAVLPAPARLIETQKGFNAFDAGTDLRNRLLHPDARKAAELSVFKDEPESVIRALGGIIWHWSLCKSGPFMLRKCWLDRFADMNCCLRLDKAAFSALHILPECASHNRTPTTLLGLLNKCSTLIGTRKLESWLRQPLVDAKEIKQRHDIVQAFIENAGLLHAVQLSLKHVPDVDKLVLKLAKHQSGKKCCTLDDLYSLWRCYQTLLELLSKMSDFIKQNTNAFSTNSSNDVNMKSGEDEDENLSMIEKFHKLMVSPLKKEIKNLSKYNDLVENTIDMDHANENVNREPCRVNRSFDPTFENLAAEMEEVMQKMQKAQEKAQKDICPEGGPKKDKITIYLEEYSERNVKSYVFRVTKKGHGQVMQRGKYESIAVKKAESIFTTEELKKLSKSYHEKKDNYETAQADLAEKCCDIAVTFLPVWTKIAEQVSSLDVLSAFGLVCELSHVEYSRPDLDTSDDPSLVIRDGVHPLVEENLT